MALVKVGDFTQDITNFNPEVDQLDFGQISVHSLILGQDSDGTATIVYPWQPDQYQRILGPDGKGIQWSQLSEANFAPVGNEHLRGDIGGVFSWEQGLGPAFAEGTADQGDTVYIRSHEQGSVTTITDFNPLTDKINFLYFGTRERLIVENDGPDLVIYSEPIGQRFIFINVQKEELVGANLEFHFDQIEEDLLDRAFGFEPHQLSLVSRDGLFTPEGGPTDGDQIRLGAFVTATGDAPGTPTTPEESARLIMERGNMPMEMMTNSEDVAGIDGGDGFQNAMASVMGTSAMAMAPDNGPLQLSASGTLYWGGMGGSLTITNTSDQAVENWSVSFDTPHSAFQTWAGAAEVEPLADGINRITLTPASWNSSIAAGQSIEVSFNAVSQGLANSGELSDALFFAQPPMASTGSTAAMEASMPMAQEPQEPVNLDAAASQPPLDVQQPDADSPALGESQPVLNPVDTAVVPPLQALDQSPAPVQPGPIDALDLSVSGNLWWGGMSGVLNIRNGSNEPLDDWELSFLTPHTNFQSWSSDVELQNVGDGLTQVTLRPAAWNSTIAAGGSIDVSFNADSVGLPNSGDLTGDLFFAATEFSSAYPREAVEQQVIETLEPEPEAEELPPSPADPEDAGAEVDAAGPAEVDAIEESIATPIAPEGVALVAERAPLDAPVAASEQRVVAYFEEWGIYSRDFLVQDINVAPLTHINYSFFDVSSTGDVTLFDAWAATDKRFSTAEQVSQSFSRDEWLALSADRRALYDNGEDFTASVAADGSVVVSGVPVSWESPDALAGNLRQLELLKQLNPELNLGLALGGWTLSDDFSLAVDSVADREAFTDSIIETLKAYDFFTVVDFDWEYPGGGGKAGNAFSADDGANFEATLELLRGKLDELEGVMGQEYEVSIATAGGYEKLANLNLEGIDPYVDFYNVMTYDFHGGWEPQTGHQAAMTGDAGGYDVVTAIAQFDAAGVDRDKVVLGAPAYTRAWGGVQAADQYGYLQPGDARQAPGSFEAGNYDYKDILTGVEGEQYQLIWDDNSKAAFAYNDDALIWSSMETTATIAGKASFVQEAGLGGMMFWALSNDSQGEQSLISAASDVLTGSATAEEVAGRAPQFDAVIGGDGVFGMDDFTSLA